MNKKDIQSLNEAYDRVPLREDQDSAEQLKKSIENTKEFLARLEDEYARQADVKSGRKQAEKEEFIKANPVTDEEWEDLEKQIKSHDKTYQRSDDYRAYLRGRGSYDNVMRMIKNLEARGADPKKIEKMLTDLKFHGE